MASNEDIFSELQQGRRRFLALVDDVRPDLHRYCARMTGSIADGEDVVQDTLARAYYELSELRELPALRSWLFRIAHNRALDYLRRYDRRIGEPLDDLVPAWLDSREVIAVFRNPRDPRASYLIEVTLIDGRVTAIRDFRYVPYIARDAAME